MRAESRLLAVLPTERASQLTCVATLQSGQAVGKAPRKRPEEYRIMRLLSSRLFLAKVERSVLKETMNPSCNNTLNVKCRCPTDRSLTPTLAPVSILASAAPENSSEELV